MKHMAAAVKRNDEALLIGQCWLSCLRIVSVSVQAS